MFLESNGQLSTITQQAIEYSTAFPHAQWMSLDNKILASHKIGTKTLTDLISGARGLKHNLNSPVMRKGCERVSYGSLMWSPIFECFMVRIVLKNKH